MREYPIMSGVYDGPLYEGEQFVKNVHLTAEGDTVTEIVARINRKACAMIRGAAWLPNPIKITNKKPPLLPKAEPAPACDPRQIAFKL